MFFLFLTGMIVAFVVGTTLLVNAEIVYGSIAAGIGILLLLFVLIYYGKRKYRKKKKYDCTPDCLDCDCGPDCDGRPDCDCSPDCN
ncbi:hypothetical protein V7111_00815 [Neobacillus niacini]|uniref:hypothetical protein n=1 Tax=Neobacillus niacini TaxID=86668 RepID=UPI002FFE3B6E